MPDNAFIEAYNARMRSECLNASWFLSMVNARSRIDAWREVYNHHRPHTSFGNLNPAEFVDQLRTARERS
ncbi:integrase core domain-containing protein [Aureimonas ureilytica]|uniref:integrase core domain-containing protein n=1 Tax=Aureimonas ureilytica TaxID=401562 RepID=UPI000373A1DA